MNSLSGIRALLSSSGFNKRADSEGKGCSRTSHLDRLFDSYRRIHIRHWLQHPHVGAAARAFSVSAHSGECLLFPRTLLGMPPSCCGPSQPAGRQFTLNNTRRGSNKACLTCGNEEQEDSEAHSHLCWDSHCWRRPDTAYSM